MKAKRFIGNRKYSSKDEEMVLSDEAQAEIDEKAQRIERLERALRILWIGDDDLTLEQQGNIIDAALSKETFTHNGQIREERCQCGKQPTYGGDPDDDPGVVSD